MRTPLHLRIHGSSEPLNFGRKRGAFCQIIWRRAENLLLRIDEVFETTNQARSQHEDFVVDGFWEDKRYNDDANPTIASDCSKERIQ